MEIVVPCSESDEDSDGSLNKWGGNFSKSSNSNSGVSNRSVLGVLVSAARAVAVSPVSPNGISSLNNLPLLFLVHIQQSSVLEHRSR